MCKFAKVVKIVEKLSKLPKLCSLLKKLFGDFMELLNACVDVFNAWMALLQIGWTKMQKLSK